MPAAKSRLTDFLPYLMSVSTNAVSDMVAAQYQARFGLKIPEWRVMAVLGDAGPQTQRQLVGATRMDKVAVNRACKVLEERCLIQRSPNASDGRSHHLELTPAGRAVHEEIMPLALGIEKRLFAVLSVQERKDFKAMLARINEQVCKLESLQAADTDQKS
ncbi:MarR family winged helix-turn-helix transcriptional regulator [Novosphingobium sp. B 225]|uniref:MarR family winged helix-turn-helix transcriptional regulator n=1 Tax=Novosphingobium sp. B 225 TaxID=1961849 RepID=UPI000B4B92C8|nr:MarR family winged helix-turn-helix transcriptional regulator [Novosphingobium sp. B 225]